MTKANIHNNNVGQQRAYGRAKYVRMDMRPTSWLATLGDQRSPALRPGAGAAVCLPHSHDLSEQWHTNRQPKVAHQPSPSYTSTGCSSSENENGFRKRNQLHRRYDRLVIDISTKNAHLFCHISYSPTDQSGPQHSFRSCVTQKKQENNPLTPILHPPGFSRGGVSLLDSKHPSPPMAPKQSLQNIVTRPSAIQYNRHVSSRIAHHHRGFPLAHMHIHPHEYYSGGHLPR